jgi:hypothetical protein
MIELKINFEELERKIESEQIIIEVIPRPEVLIEEDEMI